MLNVKANKIVAGATWSVSIKIIEELLEDTTFYCDFSNLIQVNLF